MIGSVKPDKTLPKCDQGNFSEITARSWNQSLVNVVRGTCTMTAPPTSLYSGERHAHYHCTARNPLLLPLEEKFRDKFLFRLNLTGTHKDVRE